MQWQRMWFSWCLPRGACSIVAVFGQEGHPTGTAVKSAGIVLPLSFYGRTARDNLRLGLCIRFVECFRSCREIARSVGGVGRPAGPKSGRRGVPAAPGAQAEGRQAQVLFAGVEHLLSETRLGHALLRLLFPLSCQAPGSGSSGLPTMRRPGLAQQARFRALPDSRAELASKSKQA